MFTLLERQKKMAYRANSIAGGIETFYKEPNELWTVAKEGAAKMSKAFSHGNQIPPRIKPLESETNM